MTSLVLACPACHRKFQIRSEDLNRALACPHCGQAVQAAGDKSISGKVKPKTSDFKPGINSDPADPSLDASVAGAIGPRSGNRESRKDHGEPSSEFGKEIKPEKNRESSVESRLESKRDPHQKLKRPLQPESKHPAQRESPHKVQRESKREIKRESQQQSKLVEGTCHLPPKFEIPDPSQHYQVSGWDHASLGFILPPRFDVFDPVRVNYRKAGSNPYQVVLPRADGGFQTVDDRLVTIEFKGQVYHLIALSPEERKRRELLVNLVAMLIAALAILVTIYLLA